MAVLTALLASGCAVRDGAETVVAFGLILGTLVVRLVEPSHKA